MKCLYHPAIKDTELLSMNSDPLTSEAVYWNQVLIDTGREYAIENGTAQRQPLQSLRTVYK